MSDQENEAADREHPSAHQRVKEALRQIDTDFVEKGSRAVTGEDVQTIVEKADEIESRFSKEGPLGRFLEDGQLLLSLVKDYWRREYRQVPYWTVAAVVFTLLYVANPLDFIPDMLPGIGLIDDAAVLSVCLLMVEQDLYDYKAWRKRRDQ